MEYLKLVVNCLLYLQFYPEEVLEDYAQEAPKHLVNEAKLNTEVAEKAKKRLEEQGYTKIKLFGCPYTLPNFDEDTVIDIDKESEASVRTVAPHKRRAHSRKQRYGKELQSWRYVWIRETTIHKDKYQDLPQQYRIYEVSDCYM